MGSLNTKSGTKAQLKSIVNLFSQLIQTKFIISFTTWRWCSFYPIHRAKASPSSSTNNILSCKQTVILFYHKVLGTKLSLCGRTTAELKARVAAAWAKSTAVVGAPWLKSKGSYFEPACITYGLACARHPPQPQQCCP